MCDCITTINGLLSEKNTRLAVTISWGTGDAYPTIMTEKVETKKRGTSPVVIPTFCPFCGVKYEKRSA